jgi:hypothetical protein
MSNGTNAANAWEGTQPSQQGGESVSASNPESQATAQGDAPDSNVSDGSTTLGSFPSGFFGSRLPGPGFSGTPSSASQGSGQQLPISQPVTAGSSIVPTNALPSQSIAPGSNVATTNGSTPGQITGSSIDTAIQAKCQKIVDEFRAGSIEKHAAVLRLVTAIPNAAGGEQRFVAAFKSYCAALDSFQQLRLRSAQAGSGNQLSGLLQPTAPQQATLTTPQMGTQPLSSAAKRARDLADVDGDEDAKAENAVWPWSAFTAEALASAPESLRKTQACIELYNKDQKATKVAIANAFDRPQFPDSEWKNLTCGRAVNLDVVFSGLYTAVYQVNKVIQFGETEIEHGDPTPGKTVKTHGDWIAAWEPTVEATLFVFPHRGKELRDYGRHINGLFGAFSVEQAGNIINYDKSVRILVAQRRTILLTDWNQFNNLNSYWIQNRGANAVTRASQGQRSSGNSDNRKKREPCRRFNEGRCPNSSNACTYRHVCSKCRSIDHNATLCKGKASV